MPFMSADYRDHPLTTAEQGIVAECIETILAYRQDGMLAARDADDLVAEFFAKPWVPLNWRDLRGYIVAALRRHLGDIGD